MSVQVQKKVIHQNNFINDPGIKPTALAHIIRWCICVRFCLSVCVWIFAVVSIVCTKCIQAHKRNTQQYNLYPMHPLRFTVIRTEKKEFLCICVVLPVFMIWNYFPLGLPLTIYCCKAILFTISISVLFYVLLLYFFFAIILCSLRIFFSFLMKIIFFIYVLLHFSNVPASIAIYIQVNR